jgi:hypothetical protein
MELTRSFSADQFARALESWDWADIQGKQPLFTRARVCDFVRVTVGLGAASAIKGTKFCLHIFSISISCVTLTGSRLAATVS